MIYVLAALVLFGFLMLIPAAEKWFWEDLLGGKASGKKNEEEERGEEGELPERFTFEPLPNPGEEGPEEEGEVGENTVLAPKPEAPKPEDGLEKTPEPGLSKKELVKMISERTEEIFKLTEEISELRKNEAVRTTFINITTKEKEICFDLLEEAINEYFYYAPEKGEDQRNDDFQRIMHRTELFLNRVKGQTK